MALYVKQDSSRSELQEKIAAELREKQIKNSLEGGNTFGDEGSKNNVEESAFMEGTKETTGLAFVWLLIFIAIIIAIGMAVWLASQRVL